MIYDREYYTSKNYQNYLKRKFDCLAHDLVAELGLLPSDTIIDFGCGYGGLIQELHNMGYKAVYGTDISNWAIEYGRAVFPEVADRLHYYNRQLAAEKKDYIWILDVLEHMPEYEAESILKLAAMSLDKLLVARIPISVTEGEKYVLDVSNNDSTHICCHCRNWWLDFFAKMGYEFVGDIQRQSIYTSHGVLAGKWRCE